jgi:hypothetical protein
MLDGCFFIWVVRYQLLGGLSIAFANACGDSRKPQCIADKATFVDITTAQLFDFGPLYDSVSISFW